MKNAKTDILKKKIDLHSIKNIRVNLYMFLDMKGIGPHMKKIIILVFIFLIILIYPTKGNANTIVELKTNSTKINIDEDSLLNLTL